MKIWNLILLDFVLLASPFCEAASSALWGNSVTNDVSGNITDISVTGGFFGSGSGLTNVALLNAATNTYTGRQISSGFSTTSANVVNPFTVITLVANVNGVTYWTNLASCSMWFACKAGTGLSAAMSTTNLWPTFQTVPVSAGTLDMIPIPSGYILALTNSSQPTLTVTWPIQ